MFQAATIQLPSIKKEFLPLLGDFSFTGHRLIGFRFSDEMRYLNEPQKGLLRCEDRPSPEHCGLTCDSQRSS